MPVSREQLARDRAADAPDPEAEDTARADSIEDQVAATIAAEQPPESPQGTGE